MSRAAPHNTAAEIGLLGAMILSRPDIERILDHGITAQHFYTPAHQHIFNAIVDCHLHDIRIDVATLTHRLNGHGDPDALRQILNEGIGLPNITEHARIVQHHAEQRRLLALLHDTITTIREGGDPTPHLEQLTTPTNTPTGGLHIADLAAITNGTITEEHPTLLTRLDNQALIYEGRISCLLGEPSVGKSWLSLAAAAETLHNGGSTIILDWEDTPTSFVTRMRNLGVHDQVLADPQRVAHIHPELGLRNPGDLRHAIRLIEQLAPPVLVIIDAYGPALARDGIEENSNSDVLAWTDRALAPLARAGAAVLILDHVTKDPATRTRGGRGAGAKLALITGAAYEVRTAIPFARGRPGRLKLIIAKDRLGHVGPVGANAGEVVITPDADQLRIDIEPPRDGTEPFRPTHLMEKVSRYVEDATEPVSARTIEEHVSGKGTTIRDAIRLLAADGYLTDSGQKGRGGSIRYISSRPFREPEPNRVPTASNRVPDADQSNRVPASPHYEVGGGGTRFELSDQDTEHPTASTDEQPPWDPHAEPPEDDDTQDLW